VSPAAEPSTYEENAMGYKVYAIRYGTRDGGRRSEDFYAGDPHDGPHPLAYYMWAIVGDDSRAFVVDAGFRPETAARRERNVVCDPLEVLRALGVDPSSQGDVILTHLHYDHVGHYGAFPRARFWVQDQEMTFWTGRYAARDGYRRIIEPEDIVGLVGLNFDRRLQFVDGPATVAPGITVHRVGGHSPGLQVVRVETGRSAIVLASDAAHFYENFEDDRPFSIVHTLSDMYGAFDRLRELADAPGNVVPGHDPLVLERYPAVSPDLEGYAVEIVPDAEVAPIPAARGAAVVR
jgi:glyoxylase-like metal-dependent hydrolase (beta-lactamase superfamily II)